MPVPLRQLRFSKCTKSGVWAEQYNRTAHIERVVVKNALAVLPTHMTVARLAVLDVGVAHLAKLQVGELRMGLLYLVCARVCYRWSANVEGGAAVARCVINGYQNGMKQRCSVHVCSVRRYI
jgi:hypothetical protein